MIKHFPRQPPLPGNFCACYQEAVGADAHIGSLGSDLISTIAERAPVEAGSRSGRA